MIQGPPAERCADSGRRFQCTNHRRKSYLHYIAADLGFRRGSVDAVWKIGYRLLGSTLKTADIHEIANPHTETSIQEWVGI